MSKVIHMLLLPAILLSGCAEYRTVSKDLNSSQRYDVKAGDSVLVITNEDETYEFEVIAISQTSIAGDSITIKFDDIALLKKQAIDTDETVKSIGAGIGMGLGVAMIILLGVGIAVAP